MSSEVTGFLKNMYLQVMSESKYNRALKLIFQMVNDIY